MMDRLLAGFAQGLLLYPALDRIGGRVAEGLRTWGWIAFALGALTLLSALWR